MDIKDNLKPIEELDEETQGQEGETPAEGSDEGGQSPEKYTLPGDESIPEKFRGKSPEDVVKSYVELERMIGRKAEELAEGILKEKGIQITKEQKQDVKEVVEEIDFSKIDFTKMTPTDFAKWMIGEVDKRAEAKARHIVSQTSTTQETVRTEIAAAQQKHPHLKENQEYRETVLAFIENASARGETLSLEDACQKVDKLMGVKPAEVVEKKPEEEKKVIKRTGMERSSNNDSGQNADEDERMRQGIMGAGGAARGPLGGLGI